MLSRFFIDRPIFAWVIAHHHHDRGRARGVQPAGAPVPGHRAAHHRHQRQLRRRLGADAAGHGGAGHRAAAQWHRQSRLHELRRAGRRHGDHHADVLAWAPIPTSRRCRCRTSCSSPCRSLPQEVQQAGVRVNKPARNFLIVLGFISTDNSMSNEDLTDYVATNLLDPLNRTKGVGDVTDLRLAVRHAHLGGSVQAQQLRPDHRRRGRRPSARRTCRCRWARSAACRRRPGRPSTPASSARRACPPRSSSATSCCA